MTQGRRSISDHASALTAKTDPAHSLFCRRAVWAAAAAVLVFAALLFTLPDVTNNPRPLAEYGEKTLFTAFGGRSPRTLDPQRSYSSDETAYTYSIYEPPYQYAYLKRPYELEPRTVEKVAEPKYFDKSGKELPADADPEAVAESRYVLKIRRGIFYAPHPAFAKDEQGAFRYHHLDADLAARVRSPFDLPEAGTRELTAADYANGIRRIASPQVVSPIYGTMSSRIVGFPDFKKRLDAKWRAMRDAGASEETFFDLMAEPLEGVRVIDDHTLEIRIHGKDPQFAYWLAMTFFAPMPQEAERFYAQAGLRANNVSLDTWPVGTGAFRMQTFRENRLHVLERNPLYKHGFYPCTGEPDDEKKGLLKDCGKPLPLVDRVVFEVEKEAMPLQSKFLAGYYDSPFIDRVDTGLGYLVAMDDDPDKAALYGGRGLQFPKTVMAGLWYLGFNWLDPVVGGGSTPEEAERHRALRQAISIAVDWEENIAIFQKNQGMPAHGPIPPGLFGWRADGPEVFNPVVYEKHNQQVIRKPIERAKELLLEHEKTAERVAGQLSWMKQDVPTPYLDRKGLAPRRGVFLATDGKTTCIPAVDADGKLWSMQYIQEDGTKRFAKNSRKEGCFHPVGGMDALRTAPAIVIAEGYATAGSISDAIGHATVAAFDSGNLMAVATALKDKYPDKAVIIAGDDDLHLLNHPKVRANPGREKAEKAAQAVGGKAVFPVFAPGEREKDMAGFTDFNDLSQKSNIGYGCGGPPA